MRFARMLRFHFLSLTLLSGSIAASGDRCKELGVSMDFSPQSCKCEDEFPHLNVAAPKGMELKAVCDLYSYDAKRAVDLDKEKVSLDKATDSGGYFSGYFYFAGTTVLSGVVGIEPSDAGWLWFYPNNSLTPYQSQFTDFSVLNLSDSDGQQFGLPKDLSGPRWYACARAAATIRLRGIWAILSEQDSNGAHAVGIEVLNHSPFEAIDCEALTSQ